MSGPMPGSMEESPAVICLRHYGSLTAAVDALKAIAGQIALDEPGQLSQVASLKAEVAVLNAEVAALKVEVARLTEENKMLRKHSLEH